MLGKTEFFLMPLFCQYFFSTVEHCTDSSRDNFFYVSLTYIEDGGLFFHRRQRSRVTLKILLLYFYLKILQWFSKHFPRKYIVLLYYYIRFNQF